MPTSCKKDTKGCYCQWGSQKKYYYKCEDKAARARAKAKADKQGRAAHAGGYKGNIADVISKLKVFNKVLKRELKK